MSTVVIGGGPNGLAAAALLARAGRTVTLVEQRDQLGGILAGESFAEGYRHAGIVHDTATMRPWVVEALDLGRHGLRFAEPTPIAAVGADRTILLGPDLPGWSTWRAFVDRVAPVARLLVDEAPPEIWQGSPFWPLVRPAVAVRRLGAPTMMELSRIGPLCAEDWLEESISDPLARAAMAVLGLPGTWMGPRSPHGATALLLAAATAGRSVLGGPAALVDALTAACHAAGVQVRTGVGASRIGVGNGHVEGVTLTDGTTLPATAVLSAVGPRVTLLDLVHPRHLPPRAEAEAIKIRSRGILAKVHLALSGPVELARRGEPATPGELPDRFVVADDPVSVERAFDDARHRRLPRAPALDVSVLGPPYAPDGGMVVSVLVHGAPFDLDGGWTDAARQKLGDTVVDRLSRVAPTLTGRVVAREVLTPADLAQRFGLHGGHLFHGELALDQLHVMRPAPGLARYVTPIGGLFLGSSGSHPAGPSMGAGALAARALLAER